MKKTYKLLAAAGIMAGLLSLSACDVSTPAQLNLSKIRLQEEMIAETLNARQVDAAHVQRIANHFNRNATGDMTLNVSYDANNPNARSLADRQLADYQAAFTREQVSGVKLVAVPVTNRAQAEQLVVTYSSAYALPPQGCKPMPGIKGAEGGDMLDDYQFGCESEATLSRMISHPSDLMGKSKSQDGETTRYAPLINNYKTGTPNQRLEGYTASGIGG